MAFNATVIADSINPRGVRMITMELTFPRVVLAEFNTHRAFSRNAASSRAIPVEKMIQRVLDDPFIPVFQKNKKGMQSTEPLSVEETVAATSIWLRQRDDAVAAVRKLIGKYEVNERGEHWSNPWKDGITLDVHKQFANRLLEPWMWTTDIVTFTDVANYANLRFSPHAEPSMARITEMGLEQIALSVPKKLRKGQWHLPLIFEEDYDMLRKEQITFDDLIKISVGRCARVSYLTHDGRRDLQADIDLHDRLLANGHMSPFEHQGRAMNSKVKRSGNLVGFEQYRKMLPNENRTYFKCTLPSGRELILER